jgi:hypothetical protein
LKTGAFGLGGSSPSPSATYLTAAGGNYLSEREVYDLKDDYDMTEQGRRADCSRGYVRDDGRTGRGRKSKKKFATVSVSTETRVRVPQFDTDPGTPLT